jgi:hypothetical protein
MVATVGSPQTLKVSVMSPLQRFGPYLALFVSNVR